MTSPVCTTFNYNNYADATSPEKIEVKLTYCDTIGKICRRDIETTITQNFVPKKKDVYDSGSFFFEEHFKFNPRSLSLSYSPRKDNVFIRHSDMTTGCFDWDKAIDGHDHVRGLAGEEIPALGFNNTWKVIEDNQDQVGGIVTSDHAVLNNKALAVFGAITASVIIYGIYSLYKRCTHVPAKKVIDVIYLPSRECKADASIR